MKVRASWDIKTADNCKLPDLIPDICQRCRCDAYCHRQMTFEDLIGGNNEQ